MSFHILYVIVESKPEKLDLMRLLNPVAYNWRQLGEALGIKYGDLESILNNRFRDPDRLSEVLQLWFDRCPSQVTWETIYNNSCRVTSSQ